jgi:hypothetical protein
MASGILGQAALSITTNTTVYTVPIATLSVVNINVVNRSTTNTADVRIALAETGAPADSEWIEYDVVVPPRGVLERTGIAINAGKRVVIYASTGNCSANVYGLEQAA